MSLIVYIPGEDRNGERLQRMIEYLNWGEPIEIFYTLKRLVYRLRHPTGKEDIALLLASTSKDLNELVLNSHLLSSLRIILILPDNNEKNISKGHLLRPRFVTYSDEDFSDIALVLNKMKKKAFPKISMSFGERAFKRDIL